MMRYDLSESRVRLVALDLDGTLLDSRKHIPAATAGALRGLAARGVHVVLASARPPRSVRHVYEQLGLATPQINYNGALVWDEPRRAVMHHEPMAGGLVREMIAAARNIMPEIIVQCEILDRLYTDRVDERFMTETCKLFGPDVVAPTDTFTTDDVTKLMLLGDPARLPPVRAALVERFLGRVTVLSTDADLLQITHAASGKSVALKRLIDTLGIAADEVLAVGDAANDVAMLSLAGRAVAPANAHDVAKAVAHWVGPSNDEECVRAALAWAGL